MSRFLPPLRALLITLVVGGSLLYGFPVPDRIEAEDLAEEGGARQDLDRWLATLAGVGIRPDRERFARAVVAVSGAATGAQRAIRRPLRPFFRFTRTGQSWGMFAWTSLRHGRLYVDVRTDGQWRTVYRRLDPDKRWRHGALQYRRLRGVYDTHSKNGKPRDNYLNFTRWIAAERFAEDSEAEAVRVRIEFVTTSIPPERVDPDPKFELERVYHRGEVLF